MRPDDVAERLRNDEFAPGFLRPAYEDYSFANVTPTVADLLGIDVDRRLPAHTIGEDGVENVLVVLIDGLRYDRWLETDAPFFERARDSGRTTPLTSVYPSETAAAMTTYQTGRQPVEHGSLGWEQYFEALGERVEPLKGRVVGGRSLEAEVESDSLESFDGGTIHAELAAAGVGSVVVHPESTLTHPFSRERYDGATTVPYGNPAEGAVEARKALESSENSFVTLYVHHVDSVSHGWGTRTPHYEATLHMLSASLERALRDLDTAVASETLVLFTADHGHVDTGPEARGTVLTDRDVVVENLKRRPDGEPILPTGGARNVHLHLQAGSVERVREALSDLDALTWTRDEAIEANLFGDREPSDRFLKQCGDLVLVPNETSVWYDPVKFGHVGQHGGLHPDEMLVPFTATPVADLI